MAKVYLIDVDGTLTKEICWTEEECLNATPRQEVIDKVNSLGVVWIVIYTSRADELIPATLKWLRRHNVKFHAISNNKLPAGVGYVDDHAIPIKQFLEEH